MARSVALALVAAVLTLPLTGCTTLHPAANALSARDLCGLRLDDVRQAELGTVGGVRHIGPHVIDPPPSPLDAYPDDEPIALCLVPDDTVGYAAVALVLADGVTVVRWGQNVDTHFAQPS